MTTKKSTYAEDPDIDFLYVHCREYRESFAAPFLLGMIGLLATQNLEQHAIDYFADHCEDLGKAGPDSIFGRGLALMGEPEEKDVIVTETKSK